jgi:hypothetical protein
MQMLIKTRIFKKILYIYTKKNKNKIHLYLHQFSMNKKIRL